MTATVHITRIDQNQSSEVSDLVAVEEPLQIQLLFGPSGKEQTKNIAITMRTPGHDEELVAGFLYTEGIVNDRSDLISIIPKASGENTALAVFRSNSSPELPGADRNFYINSSCGLCGKTSLETLRRKPIASVSGTTLRVTNSDICAIPERLKQGQRLFHETGGIHASALFDPTGQLVLLREDVGRHNALDKLIGALMLADRLPATNSILALSGRVSFEMVQKAAMAGIEMIAAIGAPSSLSVELAIENNITLIGFLRNDRFNIYSCSERIEKSATL